MNKTVKKKVNFINLSQNEGLSPSCRALSFDEFGSILWHNIWLFFFGSYTVFTFFPPDFQLFSVGVPLKRRIKVVEMRICCIKIGVPLVLHF
jgi:hypothetical protein